VVATSATGLSIIDLDKATERPLLRWDAKSAQDLVRGMSARYDGDGHLVYVAPGGQLLAVPFDARRALVTGPAVPLAEGVRVESGRGAVQFALSASGLLAFAPGPVMSVGILVRADRNGKLDTIPAPAANYNALDLTADGRRLVARVGTTTGDVALQVIDVQSGKVTPFLSAPSIGRPLWAPDGRRVFYRMAGGTFIADPDLSASPQRVPLTLPLDEATPMADGASYRGWLGDTLVIEHTNGSPPARVVGKPGLGATSPDDRWYVSEEPQANESAIVARSLDGSGRRIVIAGGGRFAMVAWAAGGHEFVVADAQRMRTGVNVREVQGFHAVSYDPSKPDPFGAPRLLFAAAAADFPGRNYTVGMGGNRFVFKQFVATSLPREVRVMTQWHAALERTSSGVSNGLSCEDKIGTFEEVVEEDDEFAHDSGEGDFGGFACRAQPLEIGRAHV
jgi:hypothetical protein